MTTLTGNSNYDTPEEVRQEALAYIDFHNKREEGVLTQHRRIDNVLEVADDNGVPPQSVFPVVEKLYDSAGTQAAEEQYFGARASFIDAAYDEAMMQAFSAGDTDTAKILREQQQSLEQVKSLPWAHEASVEWANKGAVTKESIHSYALSSLKDLVDSSTGIDFASDVGGLLVLGSYVKDVAGVTGSTWLDAPGTLKKVARTWRTLPIDQQKVMWEELKARLLEETENNKLKTAIILGTILDPDGSDIDFETALNAIEWGTIALPVLTGLAKMMQVAGIAHRTVRLAGKEKAASLTNKVLDDVSGALSEKVNMARQEAAATANPFDYNKFFSGSVDGLAGATAEQVEDIELAAARVRDIIRPVLEEDNILKLRLLNDKEAAAFRLNTKKIYEEYAENVIRKEGWNFDKANIINKTDDGFQVELVWKSDKGLVAKKPSAFIHYNIDGVVADSNKVPKASWRGVTFLSPEVWLEAAFKANLVDEATLINYQQYRVAKHLNEAQKQLWKGTDKAMRARLDAVLHAGANWVPKKGGRNVTPGKTFTYQELREGVDVGDGITLRLSHDEAKKYFEIRSVFDGNFIALNKIQRDALKANGFMEASILGVGSKILKPFFEKAAAISEQKGTKKVWDFNKRMAVSVNEKTVDEMYNKGFVLARLHDSSYIEKGSDTYRYAFVPSPTVRELRANPLRYYQGYVPRIYKDAPYVAITKFSRAFDGGKIENANETVKVARLFSGKAQGETWKSRLAAEKQGKYEIKHISELDPETRAGMVVQEAGGLFVDERGKHLLYGLDGDKAKIWSARDALDRQLGYIAQRMPSTQWRVGVVQRWKAMAERAGASNIRFDNWNSVSLEGIGDVKVKTALEASRNWIRDQLLIPTASERRWQSAMVSMADWAEGKKGLGFIRQHIFLNSANNDPFTVARTAAFHTLLGAWNPAQLFVQAMGFSVAASIDGLHKMPMRWGQYTALRLAMNAPADAPKAFTSKLARLSGWKADEFEAILDDFRKTGLMDSVRSNADLDAMKLGMHFDSHAVGRVLQSNLIFYREGESFTRGYAYLVARDRFIKQNGLAKNARLTNDQLIAVTEMTTRKMFNLSRANRAAWQKGVLSVPTQFMQITAKYMEGMFGKRFSGTEKLKILSGQMLLFGSAGFPFAQSLIEGSASMMGVSPDELSEEQKSYIRNGLFSLLTEMTVDEGFEVGRRGAFASFLEDMTREMLSDRPSFARIASGAFGGAVGVRLWDASSFALPLIFSTRDVSWDEYKMMWHKYASVFSTYGNVHKGLIWWEHQRIMNQYGDTLVQEEIDNLDALVWGKMLGFTSETVEDVYQAANYRRNIGRIKTEAKKEMKKVMNEYFNQVGRYELTPEMFDNMRNQWYFMFQFYPEDVREEIFTEAFNEVWDGKDKEDEEINGAFNKAFENQWSYIGSPITGNSMLLNKAISNRETE